MHYNTYDPNPELSGLIKCYWTLEIPAEDMPRKQRIVPDGCMEMIFHHDGLYKQYLDDGTHIIQPRCFVFGQITKSLDIEPTAGTGIFAVRFQPDGFAFFTEMQLSSMENTAVPLEEVFGTEGIQLQQAMLGAADTKDRIRIVEAFLAAKITAKSVDGIIRSCIEIIMDLNGQLPVAELSDQLNVNRRQLERKFATVIGLSPKQLSKIIRLQAALKKIAGKQPAKLTAVAHESDYYDQAHFIKDFKEFTGRSPKEFYADDLKMSSLFSGTE